MSLSMTIQHRPAVRAAALAAVLALSAAPAAMAQDFARVHFDSFMALCEANAGEPEAALASAKAIGWTQSEADPSAAELAGGASRFREKLTSTSMFSLMVSVTDGAIVPGATRSRDCNVGGTPVDAAALRALFRTETGLIPEPESGGLDADRYIYVVDGDRRLPLEPGDPEAAVRRAVASGSLRLVVVGEQNGFAMMQMFAPQ
jgi:hypothetical protein